MTRIDVIAIRERLGLTQAQFAELLGVSHETQIRTESGDAPLTTLKVNAIRWIDHNGVTAPPEVCATCDGVGTVRRPDPDRPTRNPRVRCDACKGQGVARFMEACL